jgi:hypothetical protein
VERQRALARLPEGQASFVQLEVSLISSSFPGFLPYGTI